MIELNLKGYTDIPNGKVANIATFLEMTEKPELNATAPDSVVLTPQQQPELHRYKALFKAVGEDWLWFSRLALDDTSIQRLISNSKAEIFFAQHAGQDIGLLELDISDPKNIELAYFGFISTAVGKGLGTWLMSKAVERVFSHHKAKRFWVHTCTLDHPKALRFYMKSGFVPYKRAIEIDDDPRLNGHIAKEMGGHHPIIA